MKKQLSVLIPCYNSLCHDEVKSVWQQLTEYNLHASNKVEWEIIVVEDGSTDETTLKENAKIALLENVRYIPRKENVGRAAVRNLLAHEAKYEWLLYIDSDVCVEHNTFIKKYIESSDNIVVGGVRIFGNAMKLSYNLRYLYEKKASGKHTRTERQKHEHREFRTTNFLIARDIIFECPFDESFKSYGYEDVLFGKTLHDKGYPVKHISNPVTIIDYEDNATFVNKTEESLRTLHQFKDQLKDYSTLLKYATWTRMSCLSPLLMIAYKIFGKTIRKNLAGNNPRLSWFNIYKLLYYLSL